jgi:drug/metabolite transporter (DMT)-like permease
MIIKKSSTTIRETSHETQKARAVRRAGIIWFCIAGLLSTIINLNMRFLNEAYGYHPFQLVFCYSLLGAALYLPSMVRGGLSLTTHCPRYYVLRALLEIAGFSCIFFALPHLPFTVLITLTFTTPLIGGVFAVWLLHEDMNWRKISGLVIGFVGIVTVTNPTSASFDWWYMLPVVAACFFALCGVLIRLMARTDPPTRIAARTLILMALFSLPLAIFYWQVPLMAHLPYFIGLAVLVAAVQYSVGNALQKIELSLAHPFMFLNLIWSSLIGWVVFNESLAVSTMSGACIIIAGVVVSAWQKKSLTTY